MGSRHNQIVQDAPDEADVCFFHSSELHGQLSSTSVPLHQGERSHLRDPDIRQGSYRFPPVRNPVVTPSGGMGRGCPTYPAVGDTAFAANS